MNELTICAISDTHGKHLLLDLTSYKADVLVYAGDWTAGHDIAFSETSEFLSWLEEQPFAHKILIAGNHEVTIERYHTHFEEMLQDYPSITYLNNSSTTINGINFFGSPYSNNFYNWAFMEEEPALKKIWAKIPKDTNVLITHGPAYGQMDKVKHPNGRDPNVGSKSLTKIKKSLVGTLKLHISGHIHEASGVEVQDSIINICASVLDEKYKLVNKPKLVTIKG